MAALKDSEVRSYAGILFVRDDALQQLGRAGGDGAVEDAAVEGDRLVVSWRNGTQSQIGWPELRQRAGLGQLPPPRIAFARDGEVGLLIASDTPQPGLAFREPHSTVRSLGVLTAEGLRSLE